MSNQKDWISALQNHIRSGRSFTPPPPGWLSIADVAKLWNRTRSTTSRYLAELVKSGGAEMRKFDLQIEVKKQPKQYGPKSAYSRRSPYFRLKTHREPKNS